MAKTKKHPTWPKADECLFTAWFPKDKRHVYRTCVHPECKNIEIQEVKG